MRGRSTVIKGALVSALFTFVIFLIYQSNNVSGGPQSEFQKACGNDVKKLCADVQPGQGRIIKCLRDNKREISGTCNHFMGQVRQKAMKMRAACKDDAKKLCSQVKPGEGRIIKCLLENREKLGQACNKALPSGQKAPETADEPIKELEGKDF